MNKILRSKQRGSIGAFQCVIAAASSAPTLTIDGGSNVLAASSDFSNCGNPGSTGITNAVGSGGKPPFTYQWTLVSAPATKGPWIPVSDTNPSTLFAGSTNVCDGETFMETWQIEVTDDNTNTATDTITVTRSWTNLN